MPEGFIRLSDTKFQIPASSFTAFKLTYTDIVHVLETSKCVLLGGIPRGWYDRSVKREGLKSTYERLGAKIASRTSSNTDKIQDSKIEKRSLGLFNIFQDEEDYESPLDSGDEFSNDDLWYDSDTEASLDKASIDDLDEETNSIRSLEIFEPEPVKHDNLDVPVSMSLHDNKHEHRYGQDTRNPLKPMISSSNNQQLENSRIGYSKTLQPNRDQSVVDSNNRNYQVHNNHTLSNLIQRDDNLSKSGLHQHLESQHEQGVHNRTMPILQNKNEIPLVVTDPETGNKTSATLALKKDEQHPHRDAKPILKVPSTDAAKSILGDAESFHSAVSIVPTVRFNPEISEGSVASSKRSSIAVVDHNPVDDPELLKRKVKFQKDLYHLLHRLRKSSSRISRKQKTATKKFVKSIIKRFNNGEVIMADKFLTLVKSPQGSFFHGPFNEFEQVSTITHSDWKEYLVVLRKNDEVDSELEIQICKSSEEADLKKPVYVIPIETNVMISFYSTVDKTIAVNAPDLKEKGNTFYILQARNSVTAFHWLFIMGQSTTHSLNSIYHIDVPSLDLSVQLKIPRNVLAKIHANNPWNTLEILPKGYRFEYEGIIKYLRDTIIGQFSNNVTLKSHLSQFLSPWFCFKYYDRIRWLVYNDQLFHIENCLRGDHKLQLVERYVNPNSVELPNGTILHEPVRIEGFLARMSDAFGDEVNLFKRFYKMLYFYTSDYMLFYTKFFRGMPPSPGNVLMENGDRVGEFCESIGDYYEHLIFPLDSNNHVEWFNERDFVRGNRVATNECKRSIHQIIKASGVIDMRMIKEIRRVPIDKVNVFQRSLHALMWYGSDSALEAEEFIDSAFELEMVYGSKLLLQAPNRAVRDKWLNRLNELKTYWQAKSKSLLDLNMKVRQANTSRLELTQYVDSNINSETNPVELQHSIADPRVYNMDGIGLNRLVSISGYLYVKYKKHTAFLRRFVVVCPGFIRIFRIHKRSKITGVCKDVSCFEHQMTIPLNDMYMYSGELTSDILNSSHNEFNSKDPGQYQLPRVYIDGWRSMEEEPAKCFNLWVGNKRDIHKVSKTGMKNFDVEMPKNPGFMKLYKNFGVTGKNVLFLCRSRQEKELWVSNIQNEVNRFASLERFKRNLLS